MKTLSIYTVFSCINKARLVISIKNINNTSTIFSNYSVNTQCRLLHVTDYLATALQFMVWGSAARESPQGQHHAMLEKERNSCHSCHLVVQPEPLSFGIPLHSGRRTRARTSNRWVT